MSEEVGGRRLLVARGGRDGAAGGGGVELRWGPGVWGFGCAPAAGSGSS